MIASRIIVWKINALQNGTVEAFNIDRREVAIETVNSSHSWSGVSDWWQRVIVRTRCNDVVSL